MIEILKSFQWYRRWLGGCWVYSGLTKEWHQIDAHEVPFISSHKDEIEEWIDL